VNNYSVVGTLVFCSK